MDTTAGNEYAAIGLSANTGYYFKVTAVNALGNDGTLSAAASATTLPAGDSQETALQKNVWHEASISGAAQYYKFSASAGTSYQISWNDFYEGSGNKTGDIQVSAYMGSAYYFTKADSAYAAPKTKTPTASGEVILKVEPVSPESYGTYAIKYWSIAPDPAAPTVSAGLNMLTVQWAAVTGASAYEVWVGTSNDSGMAEKYGGDIAGLTTEINSLENGTTYYVWVKAKNSVGTISGFSPNASGKPLAPPEPPTIIAGNWQLTVSWAAAGGADEYEVYYGTGTPTTLWDTVNETTTTITGFVNEGTYNVRIRGKNTSGVSAYSGTASGTITVSPGLYDGVINGSGYLGSYSLADSITHLNTNSVTTHSYYILLGGGESANSIDLSFPGKSVSITLKGLGTERKINLNADTTLFTTNTGVTLTLDDKITLVGRSTNVTSLVIVNGGTLVMKDGAKICGNANTRYGSFGGGVSISSYGIFTMDGGEISGNSASSDSDSDSLSFGGGVYSSGSFTMSGGTISGNTATVSNYSYGGGVYSSGTFTMSGGTISDNTATAPNYSYGGGGVYSSGTFTMSGGTISGNTATATSSSSSYGGGVSISAYSTFAMSGGTISGNTANNGGGVYSRSATFTMSGGTISGNTATATTIYYSYGGGVYIVGDGSTFKKAAAIGCSISSNTTIGPSNNGNQVYVSSSPSKKRNTTAGADVVLESTPSGAAGGWE
jgi:hypothetical protein